jgi:hypothetical protein
MMMDEKSNRPAPLDYAGPGSWRFLSGWRGWVGAVAIMTAIAALLVVAVFIFSMVVRLRRGT